MIKIKHLLNEIIENNSIQMIVDRVYPQIVKDLGGQMKPVEVHDNIWKSLDAVGIEDLKREQGNPDARYDPYDDIISLFSEKTYTEEDIIRSLLHEHTHTLQDQKEFKKLYDQGFNYGNHPFEEEAKIAERNWRKYLAT